DPRPPTAGPAPPLFIRRLLFRIRGRSQLRGCCLQDLRLEILQEEMPPGKGRHARPTSCKPPPLNAVGVRDMLVVFTAEHGNWAVHEASVGKSVPLEYCDVGSQRREYQAEQL